MLTGAAITSPRLPEIERASIFASEVRENQARGRGLVSRTPNCFTRNIRRAARAFGILHETTRGRSNYMLRIRTVTFCALARNHLLIDPSMLSSTNTPALVFQYSLEVPQPSLAHSPG